MVNVTSTNPASLAEPRRSAASNRATWFGLCISLFSLIVVSQLFHALAPHPGVALSLAREAAMFACAGFLFWIVRSGERLPLASIGIGTSPLWKSLAWGVVSASACVIPAALIARYAGYGHSAASHIFDRLPVWLIFLIVVRAGVVEEFFYRAYSIDRLQRLGFGRIAASLIPLVIFAAAHWSGGPVNSLMALSLGAIFTAFYLWRRDLVSNIFGHFLIDFVANVIPALLA
ncbi:MAG: CPBP family intramembrane glutamic endopeptidase [Terracidiphilus sp.]|jgi:membrane protease YdiL (CAAX protease family)